MDMPSPIPVFNRGVGGILYVCLLSILTEHFVSKQCVV